MRGVDPSYIVTAGLTDVGRVRSNNQDSIGEFIQREPSLRLLVVADGMGGHRGGEVASQMAVEAVRAAFQGGGDSPPEVLRAALERANQQVNEASQRDRSLNGMGTTCVAMLFGRGGQAWVAHVGDSRAYRLRGGQLTQLTDDHSIVGELVRMGRISAEEARTHPQRNEILRAIGTQETVAVDLEAVPVQPGDRFLLCSDGLYGMLTDAEIAEVLRGEGPNDAARILVDRANERGGVDNISVQIAVVPAIAGHDISMQADGAPRASGLPGLLWAAMLAAAALLFWLLFGP